MSTTIDEKVVEMRFDNQHFEKNVQTSLSTLDKLKNALNFGNSAKSLDSLDKAAKNVSFDGMAAGIENLQNRFSALGIVGMTVLQNLTNSAINAGKKMVGAVLDPIKEGGWNRALNIEQAKFQLSGLKVEWDDIKEDINYGVKSTAYGLDAAAKAASQLVASGVKFGKESDSMRKALRGISGVAAMTSSSYEDISKIFTTVAGNGRLMGDQLLQMSSRGLNAAATLANYLGKTESQVREMVSKGQIDFETFASAMDDAFGEHAKDANKTFTGAMSNVRAALSRIGADFAAPALENLKDVFNALIPVIDEVHEKLAPFITDVSNAMEKASKFVVGFLSEEGLSVDAWDKFAKETGKSSKDLMAAIKEAAREHGVAIDEIIKDEGSFRESLKQGWLSKDILSDALDRMIGGGNIEETIGNLESVREAALKVIRGDYGNDMDARFAKLMEDGYNPETVQKYVNVLNKLTNGTFEITDAMLEAADAEMGNTEALSNMSDAELENLGYTKEQIEQLRELAKTAEETGTPLNELLNSFDKPSKVSLLIDSFKNAFSGLAKILGTVKGAFQEIFPPKTSDQIYSALEGINNFSKKLIISDETAEKLKRVFKGVFAGADIVFQGISALIGGFKDLLKFVFPAGDGLLGLAAKFGDYVVKLRDSIKENETFKKVIASLEQFLAPVAEKVKEVGQKVLKTAKKFKDWAVENKIFSKGFKAVTSGFKTGISVLRKWINEFLNLPIVKGAISKVTSFLGDLFGKVEAGAPKAAEAIKEFGKKIQSLSLDDVKQLLINFKNKVLDYFTGGKFLTDITGLFSKIKNAIGTFVDTIKNYFGEAGDSFSGIGGILSNFADTVKEKLGQVNWGGVLAIVTGIFGILAIKKIANFAAKFESLGGIITGVSSVLNSFSAKLKAEALEKKTKALMKIAGAIAILAGVIVVLGKLDQAELIRGGLALAAIAIVLGILVAVNNKLGGENFASGIKGGSGMLAFAMSLLVIVGTLKVMETLDGTQLSNNLAILLTIMVVMAGLSYALGRTVSGMPKGSMYILAFAVAIKILVSALKAIDRMKIKDAWKSTRILISIMMALGIVSKMAGSMKLGTGIGFLALVVGIKMLIGVIDKIADLDVSKITKNIGSFIAVFALISVLMLSTKLAGKNAAGGGVAILAIAIALNLMVSAVKRLGEIKSATAMKGVKAISKLMTMIAVVMMSSILAGKNAVKAGAMILMVTGALLALSVAIAIISNLDPTGVDRAVQAIGTLIVGFAALMAVTQMVQQCNKTLVVLVATISIMAIALGALSFADTEKLESARNALSMVMGVFAVMMLMTKYTNVSKGVGKTILAMLVTLAGVTAALYFLSTIETDSMLQNAEALSLVLLALTAALTVLTTMHVGVGGAAMAGAALDVFVIIIGALVGIIGLIDNLTNGAILESLQAGIPIITAVGEAIGGFIGGIIGGVASGASSALPEIGSNLSAFMDNAASFFEGLKTYGGSEALDAVETLINVMDKLISNEVWDTLTGWRNDTTLENFGDKLSTFAGHLGTFSENLSDLDDNDLAKINTAATSIEKLATAANKIPGEGGVWQQVFGEKDISGFGDSLTNLGAGLATFSDNIEGLTDEKLEQIDKATSAIESLAGACDTIPGEGGVWQQVFGEKDISGFGEDIGKLGTGLGEFATNIGELDEDKISQISAATTAINELAEAANKVPESGGEIQKFFGGKSLGHFGQDIEQVAKGLKTFSDEVSGMTDENMAPLKNAVDLVSDFASIAQTLPETGGLAGIIFGDQQTIGEFGDSLGDLGTGLSTYSDSIQNVDTGKIKEVSGALRSLLKLNDLVTSEEIQEGYYSYLERIGEDIGELGDYLDDLKDPDTAKIGRFVNAIQAIIKSFDGAQTKNSAIDSFSQSMSSLSDLDLSSLFGDLGDQSQLLDMKSAGEELMGALADGISSMSDDISNAVNDNITAAINKAGSVWSKLSFNGVGMGIDESIASGIDLGKAKVVTAIGGTVSGAVTAVRFYYNGFHSAGSYLADGFSNGILSGIFKARIAAAALAAAAVSAAKEKLKINSPSKVFYGIGAFGGIGFVNALYDYSSRAYNAGAAMAESARSGLNSTIATIADVVGSDIDYEPAIRPVLDLSSVKDGVNTLDGMLSLRKPIGLMANVESINSSMNARRNASNNDDVVSAINSLRKSIANSSGNSYSINGITYDDGSNVADAVGTLIRAVKVERRAQGGF